ncbi:cupin domain-containing protein [Polyangium spumosum]|uniref:Cupin domain-containing protein n=1 Tax=Polyangium spumosum TaxID=889282 RepID=A0A6N7PTR3_9BACT|nr:cupin domain-containing protein [Polyangium spumosum]MRG93820.1 cupin domain-containing protein [Polyangium spumosum]
MGHGERFASRVALIAPKVGAQKLGYNVTIIPPGKRAFPLHNHHVNEEMFFVLEGEGELRLRDERHPIRRGDVIACPPGGPESAHQIINTSDSVELKLFAVSTKMMPEVVDYPDSGRFGVLAELGTDAEGKPRTFRYIGREKESLDYWEGNE